MKKWLDEETKGGSTVACSPFKGLKLGQASYCSSIYLRLMGLYEKELINQVEAIIVIEPTTIIEIGAAEGYYACGFAYRLRERTKVVAYEADVHFRYILKRNIQRNALDPHIEVKGACSVADLQKELNQNRGKLVIVCDAEGWEHELLDNEAMPELRRVFILVELHDFYLPEIGLVLQQRFNRTHHISEVHSQERTHEDLGAICKHKGARFLPKSTINHFFRERPRRQTWLFLEPKIRE